jgi:hypothetical protein
MRHQELPLRFRQITWVQGALLIICNHLREMQFLCLFLEQLLKRMDEVMSKMIASHNRHD